jgi:hypothetical protein
LPSNDYESDRIEREVTDSWREHDLGVRVDTVTIRRGTHERTRMEVYAKRRSMRGTLDGNGVEEVVRWEKIDELSEQASTEVLFGLAEAFGYNLEVR